MCESMVDIQSAAAENRQGKRKKKKDETRAAKYNWAAIKNHRLTAPKKQNLLQFTACGKKIKARLSRLLRHLAWKRRWPIRILALH